MSSRIKYHLICKALGIKPGNDSSKHVLIKAYPDLVRELEKIEEIWAILKVGTR